MGDRWRVQCKQSAPLSRPKRFLMLFLAGLGDWYGLHEEAEGDANSTRSLHERVERGTFLIGSVRVQVFVTQRGAIRLSRPFQTPS